MARIVKLLLIVEAVLIVYLVVFYFSAVSFFSQFQPITSVNFNKNGILDIKQATIFGKYKLGPAFPNENLILHLTVAKLVSSNAVIKPLVYTSVGNNPEQPSIINRNETLNSNSSETYDYDFFSLGEGENNLRVAIEVTYQNGKESKLEFVNGTATFSVISTTDKLLTDQNNTIFWGLVVSAISGMGALIFTAYQTYSSKQEREQTLRAWLGQKGATLFDLRGIYNSSSQMLTPLEWAAMTTAQQTAFNPVYVEYVLTLKNYGAIPAFNVRARMVTTPNSDFKELKGEYGEPAEIMPDDEHTYPVIVSWQLAHQLQQNTNFKFYLFFEIKYNSGKIKKEKVYGFMSEFSHDGKVSKLDHWDEDRYKGWKKTR